VRRVDVAIVGAGPSGSASALFLSGHGLQILLVDRAVFPRDKVCGEAISPGALSFLDEFGLLAEIERQGAFPYRGVLLATADGLVAEACYPDHRYGLAFPREGLDYLLLKSAASRVEVLQGTAVEGVSPQDGGYRLALKGKGVTDAVWARVVISAEGRFARVLTEPSRDPGPPARFAVVSVLEGVAGLGKLLEFHLLESAMQVVISAQSPDRAAIAVVLDGPQASRRAPEAIKDFLSVLKRDPLLADRIRGARLLKPPRGMGLEGYRPAAIAGDGWLAVGDAVGNMDPITGEGMFRAFRTAQLAAETLLLAFERGDLGAARLSPYVRAVNREFLPTYRFIDMVVALSRRPKLTRFALRAIATDPVLAERMAAYQGALAPASGLFSPRTLGRLALAGAHASVTAGTGLGPHT